MAKRGRRRKTANSRSTEAIGGFAEDLGRILGTAQAKADQWIGQRGQIAKTLQQIRDTATGLLGQLGFDGATAGQRRGPGRPPKQLATAQRPRGRRKMSAKARKAISEAQKKRWAKVRADRAK